MSGFPGKFARLAFTAAIAVLPVSCNKPGDVEKADLKEAGYQLTAEGWFRASAQNDWAALQKFIAAGFHADARNADGDSALHIAAREGAEKSAEFLLNRKLPVDQRGNADRTPLMVAVVANQTKMVNWLLRQGADPTLKDKDGFAPLMLAVREGRPGSVAELAAYDRESLDSAILLAALVGRTDVIDSLTNFGASVYTRMDDGRTPLMVAAENGHADAVQLLLELGSSRYTRDADNRTAVDIATAAGYPEIATRISREPHADELVLETPEKIAESMDSYVDAANAGPPAAENETGRPTSAKPAHDHAIPINGETLSTPVSSSGTSAKTSASGPPPGTTFDMPPLVMRHYRETETPVSVKKVEGDTATVSLARNGDREVKVRTGALIPGTNLLVVKVRKRMESGKVSQGLPEEIATVQVRDETTGSTREWISGVPANSHDPVALVEDAATGRRYLATPGQRFRATDGSEYFISDVRPNQMVIQDVASGSVRTIPLRGPRG
ncbi:ankyrin repeat domain-containing protein [Luteolibacter yonseiensis]|uniref:Ankyrin repeat domain-containing protein n=1 Tax=Luteolibacter yonseiensis TaxID=1144680 RepID=A0A934VCN4_9BACT|nr:ankyrin repeat domain-containing protein [Luteolibacter yonseiensis]MBK1816669.1 ankyrin repeat domain-containing protein [Luteolibacter yonseiensis]